MKQLASFVSFFCLNLLVFGQTTGEFIPFEKSSLLWKIEGKGLKRSSYLFGTMHLIEKQLFYFPEELKKIVKGSDLLVMELNGIPSSAEALPYLKLDSGSFFDYFSEEQIDTIHKWAKNLLQISETQFKEVIEHMKPFVVVQLATQLHFLGKTESYEMELQSLASKNEIKIEGLETIAEQMALFDGLNKETQSEMVMQEIREPQKMTQQTKKMEQTYLRQHVDSLYAMIAEEGVFPYEQAQFIDERNKKWIPKIENYITKNQAFIAVGAGHLGGPNGLIRLLQQKGYSVNPVKL